MSPLLRLAIRLGRAVTLRPKSRNAVDITRQYHQRVLFIPSSIFAVHGKGTNLSEVGGWGVHKERNTGKPVTPNVVWHSQHIVSTVGTAAESRWHCIKTNAQVKHLKHILLYATTFLFWLQRLKPSTLHGLLVRRQYLVKMVVWRMKIPHPITTHSRDGL